MSEVEAAAEVEVVDPIDSIRDNCKNASNCRSFLEKFESCGERQGKSNESCEEEFVDLLECADVCVASQIFKHLK